MALQIVRLGDRLESEGPPRVIAQRQYDLAEPVESEDRELHRISGTTFADIRLELIAPCSESVYRQYLITGIQAVLPRG